MELARVKRGFIDVDRRQMHYRHAGAPGPRPLLMLHFCPGSSKQIEHLICRFGRTRPVFAPDYPGNGDSEPTDREPVDIAYLAEVMLRGADTLGLEKFDLFGVHTGARVATEIALNHPERVGRLVLEGFGFYSATETADILERYFPRKQPDAEGTHLLWAWHFVRDAKTWFPWYDRRFEKRMLNDLPSADALHDDVIELLKAIRTYHKTYAAAFPYPMAERVPRLAVPTMLAFPRNDIVIHHYDAAVKLLPQCVHAILPCGSVAKTSDADMDAAVATMQAFLDG